MQKMDIGLIGLGVMGENLALNLARHGLSLIHISEPTRRS